MYLYNQYDGVFMAIIIIDFDNTITDYDSYPEVSSIRNHAKEIINKYYDLGHCIIINTCRCDDALELIIPWLALNGIKYCHINENCPRRVALFGNDTRKVGGHIHIDDKDIHIIDIGIDWLLIDKKLETLFASKDFNWSACNKHNL